MKVLLDTNIVIHRETGRIMNSDIGVLFKWLDDLQYKKYIHPLTLMELNKYKDKETVKSFEVKLQSYNILKTEAPWENTISTLSQSYDKNDNDIYDTKLLNEVYCGRLDILISEDKKIHFKAKVIGISEQVYSINSFLEKVTKENPDFVDYKVLSIKKEHFGNINIADPFFQSLKQDYINFEKWFNKKADDIAYVCRVDESMQAFLYLKVENEYENYIDISPNFLRKKRLKIGTFKVTLNGFKLGERFLKIIFDNAVRFKVDEVYVTIFNKRLEQQYLINLLEEYGFVYFGKKGEDELVYTRQFLKRFDIVNPKITFPFLSKNNNIFIVPIRPEYHTSLFPDSLLHTESPNDFIENLSFRNAIEKTYITRSIEKSMKKGDIFVFYRSGGSPYKSVITTIGIVDEVITNIKNIEEFIKLSRRKTVYSEKELIDFWSKNPRFRPYLVNFLYTYTLQKRVTAKRLYELGILHSPPLGITKIKTSMFNSIIEEANVDECIIVD